MTGSREIQAFLAQHTDGRVIGQLPAMLSMPVNEVEAEFQRKLLYAGHSTSYIALLGLAATLTFDAGEFFPADGTNRRDQNQWHGYHRGLQTALACLVMHETGTNPRQAALMVAKHTEALIRCRWSERLPKRGG
jgi:hypothetical protein